MLVAQGDLRAVCWGDVNALEIREGKSPLEVVLCGCGEDGRMRPLPRQELLLFTALNPEPGSPYGVSAAAQYAVSRGHPAENLPHDRKKLGARGQCALCRRLQAGRRRMERGSASERAGAIAAEWSEAMRDSQSRRRARLCGRG